LVEPSSAKVGVSSQPTGAAYFTWTFNLSPKETEVLDLLCQGLLQKQIAQELRISVQTTKNHCHQIYQKLGVSNKGQCLVKCGPLVYQHRKQTKLERIIEELEGLISNVETVEQKQAIEDTIRILRLLVGLGQS